MVEEAHIHPSYLIWLNYYRLKLLLGLDHLRSGPMPTMALTARVYRNMALEKINVVSGDNSKGFTIKAFLQTLLLTLSFYNMSIKGLTRGHCS